jgi:hypothetical protein
VSSRRYVAIVLLTVAVGSTGREARAAEFVRHVEPGVLIGKNYPGFELRPALGGDVTTWWAPLDRVGIGLETGVAITRLPYNTDAEGLGMLGTSNVGNSENITLLPRLMVGPRVALLPGLSLGGSVGSTWIWAGPVSEFVVIPYPTASAAIETRFGAQGRYGVRIAASYTYDWRGHGKAIIASTIAFSWQATPSGSSSAGANARE